MTEQYRCLASEVEERAKDRDRFLALAKEGAEPDAGSRREPKLVAANA